MTCRICSSATRTLLDLGESPPANSLKQSPDQPEESYPLVLEQCDRCGNVQLRDCVDARALYSQYLYMTPDSPSLTRHYTALEQHLTDRGVVRADATVLEIGSNTGMFLRHLQPRVRRVVGIDPAANICQVATRPGSRPCATFLTQALPRRSRIDLGTPTSLWHGIASPTTAIRTRYCEVSRPSSTRKGIS